MRYILCAIPEHPNPAYKGYPDPNINPVTLAALPEGAHTLHVLAHWTVTEDGKFQGGTEDFKVELEES